jgi:Zn-finger nucleic acid-binding protein
MSELHKPSNQEEEYFAREEVEKKRRIALKQAEELEQKTKDELKQLHFMKCPKCGMDLHTIKRGHVDIDTCFHCNGVWLDQGELEELSKHGMNESRAGAVMRAVLNIFKRNSSSNEEPE